jgi:hypothetical protein
MEKEGQALRNYLKSLNLISDEEMKASELRDLQFQEEIANLKRVTSGDELEEDEEEEGEGEDDEEDNDDSDRQDGEEGDDESEAIQRNFGVVSPEKQPQSSPLTKKNRNNNSVNNNNHVLSLTSSNLESIPAVAVVVAAANNNKDTSKTLVLSPRIPDSKSSTTTGTTTNSSKSSFFNTTNNVSSINSPTDTELSSASLKRKMAMNELCSKEEKEGRLDEQATHSEAFPLERAAENQKTKLSVNDNNTGKIDPISYELLKKRRKTVHGTDEVSIAFE